MKNIFCIVGMLVLGMFAHAQSPHFVYVQSEPAQPFTILANGQTIRSSQSGYLIVSAIYDSTLQITVRFPDQKQPDQRFLLRINNNDQGYLLKDYGDKGWGLLDWRSLRVCYAETGASNGPVATAPAGDDFASLLARASGDTTLLVKQKERATAPEPVAPAAASKPAVIESKPVVENKPATPAVAVPSYCKSLIGDQELSAWSEKLKTATTDAAKLKTIRELGTDRCFTTTQLRLLAADLLTDEARYDLLLECWSQTAARDNYLSLAEVFKQSSFAERFKLMFQ